MSSHPENGTSALRPEEATPTTLDTPPHADQNRLSTEDKYQKTSTSLDPHELEEQELANTPDRELFYAMATRRLIYRNVLKVIAMVIMDVALPVLLYFVLKGPLGNPAYALLIGGVPALIMVILRLIYARSVDALGILVFLAFLVSAIVAFASGDARILTFEKSIVTLILGVGFIITVLPIKFRSVRLKPFMLLVVKQLVPLGTINPSLVYGPTNSASVEPVDQQFTSTNNVKPINSVHPAEMQPNEKPADNAIGATPEENGVTKDSIATNNLDLENNKRPNRRRSKFNKYIMAQLFGNTTGPSVDKYDWMYQNSHRFRFDITFLTIWWGFILFLEFIIRLALVLSPVSLDQVVTYANIAFGVICAIGGVVSIIYLFFRFKGTKAQVDERLREERLVDEEGMMLIEAEEQLDM